MRRYLTRIIAVGFIGVILLFSNGWCADNEGVQPGTNGDVSAAGTDQSGNADIIAKEPATQTDAPVVNDQPGDKGASERSTDELIGELKARGVINEEQAGWLLQKYHAQSVRPASGSFDENAFIKEVAKELSTQMKQDVQNQVKDELKSEILKEARLGNWTSPLPEWVNRFRFSGDIRFRFQGDYFSPDNGNFLQVSNGSLVQVNTTSDRERLKLRARFNLLMQIADQWDSGVSIATGTTNNPVSNNVTLGDYQNNKSIVLTRAYIRYRPMPELSLWAGRMPNPWFSTDLVWDTNLNFDGAALQFDTQIGRPFRGFFTAGAFPIQEVAILDSLKDHYKWLYAAQVGAKWRPSEILNAKFGIAYYYYKDITGKVSRVDHPGENSFTAPLFSQKGNTYFNIDPSGNLAALATDFHELDFITAFDIAAFDPIHVTLTGDIVKNIGFDRSEVEARTGDKTDAKDTGYQIMLGIGHQDLTDYGKWRVSIAWKYLGSDSVVDAYTNADFHGGGTNAKGYVLTGEAGLAHNVWCSLCWFSTNEIEGPKLAQDTLQLDLNVKF